MPEDQQGGAQQQNEPPPPPPPPPLEYVKEGSRDIERRPDARPHEIRTK